MADSTPVKTPNTRPYRSHAIPACDRCKKRKIRCDIDLPGQPCRYCRARQDTCKYMHKNNAADVSSFQSTGQHVRKLPKKRRSHILDVQGTTVSSASGHGDNLVSYSSIVGTSPAESTLMMNPHMAEDITVLGQYLSSQAPEGNAIAKLYSTISNASGNPIVYLTVPRRRTGLRSAIDPGRTQREIIEQILYPFADEVRNLYFDHLHPCFPILDEYTFTDMWHRDNNQISSTLLCDLYASTLCFWDSSEVLRLHPRPDVRFVWNQAVAALQEDFMAPTISTVHAALLDMVGRPVLQVTGNIVNAGRVVTLAQSLGLHRDPTMWKATAHEKSVRIRLWWGILIHDYWSSIGHGIPPTINPRYYDVPLPSPEILATSSTSGVHNRVSYTFIHLCKLSQILGDILPHVYSLQLDVEKVSRSLRRVECALDDWAIALPEDLRLGTSGTSPENGASNLWFSYLSIKVLVCRLTFKVTIKSSQPSTLEARQYRLAMMRQSASDIVDFVTSLNEAQIREFWMPYTSYLLVTAATILLRCTIECSDLQTKIACATKLLEFRVRLQSASEKSGWDLADFCLERCHEPIQKVADALKISSPNTQRREADPSIANAVLEATEDASFDAPTSASTTMSDFFLPIDSLDYPWETLWDTNEGPWPIQI
ncbi:fungal-specific transcription factor domain-containing protein [Pyrenochaeta sp. MPI-SDFR-AT-0127]|nr:fungal-specific transcription factor domain-containing protein [Pyrenochaeta sp. MPI-SDFR-AT-0127]